MNLSQYDQHKLTIAEILRAISRLMPDTQREWQDRIRALFERLADDRFNLVVVGRFNKGKTSLMNAIMATDRLPTDIVPLTSVITTVRYGSKERVLLQYDERILTKEVPIEVLPQYITQHGNPGNIQRIRAADVQLPVEILRQGFYFVDTPGLGSAILENTRTTQTFLPEADAFLLVTSYESPLSEDEVRFFKAVSAWRRRIFIVLNKHDMVSADERARAFAFVSRQLKTFFGDEPPKLFSVSATLALRAKQSRNNTLLEASGIAVFEEHLIKFLLTEKKSQFLNAMCARLTALLQETPNSKGTEELLSRIESVLVELRADAPQKNTHGLSGTETLNLHQAASCEICVAVREKIWDFLSKYQYDLVVKENAQQGFAKRGGFCPFHTWEYESIASAYGTCNSYPPLLDRLAAGLHAAAADTGFNQKDLLSALKDLQPSNADCSLCDVRDKAEQSLVQLRAEQLSKNSNSLGSLSAICLPHLFMLSALMNDSNLTRNLMERQAQLLQRISHDMRRNALKQDAVRRYLATEEEDSAAQRALLAVAGRRNVNFDCGTRLFGKAALTKCELR